MADTVLNVFDNDFFGLTSLTDSIDKLPYKPNRLGQLNIFDEKSPKAGIRTTTATIEERHGRLRLLKTEARGTMTKFEQKRHREAKIFRVPYIPHNDTVTAEDLKEIRPFRKKDQIRAVAQEVNDRMEGMKEDHEFTWEYQRIGAVKGEVLDADGSTIYNWFNEFGITQKVIAITVSSDNIKLKFHEATRHVQDMLGGETYTHLHGFCGKDFMDLLSTAEETKKAYDRWLEGKALRDGHARKMFSYADLQIEEYRGQIGSTPFVEDNACYVIPMGTRTVFSRYNAHGTFMETVGQKGKPIYVKQARDRWNTKVDLHSQSSPLFICKRPAVLVKITIAA